MSEEQERSNNKVATCHVENRPIDGTMQQTKMNRRAQYNKEATRYMNEGREDVDDDHMSCSFR